MNTPNDWPTAAEQLAATVTEAHLNLGPIAELGCHRDFVESATELAEALQRYLAACGAAPAPAGLTPVVTEEIAARPTGAVALLLRPLSSSGEKSH